MEKTKKKKQKDKKDATEQRPPEGAEAPETDASDAEQAAPAAEAPKQEDEALEMRLLRLQADFDNYRKRTQRERVEWQRQAREDLLRDLLPVLDHYELGLNTALNQRVEQGVIDGFKMVYNQFVEALGKNDVRPIDAEGETFDHNLHEAITHVPSEEHPANTVIAQTRRGWRIGDKLLRAAQVVVSSGPAEEEQAVANGAAQDEKQEH